MKSTKIEPTKNETLHELAKRWASHVRNRGCKTTLKKVKEGLAQAYGFPNYAVCIINYGGNIPREQFIEPTLWRVIGYANLA